jgi:hypothetical protein
VTKPYVKEHIITLHSNDRRAGTPITSAVFDINKPVEITGHRAVIFVDKFLVDTDPLNTVETATIEYNTYNIHIPEISQPLSYSSDTKGNSDIVLSWGNQEFQNNSGCGLIPIVDKGLFRSKQITVNIRMRSIEDMSFWTQPWTLVFIIQEELYE